METGEKARLCLRMVTTDGFIRLFWEMLALRRDEKSETTQREVFNELNGLYEEAFGEPKFSSMEAFRKARDRHSK